MRLPLPEEQPTVPLWPDAGTALGISRSSAYLAARNGEIRTIRIGSTWRVPTAWLRHVLELDTPAEVT